MNCWHCKTELIWGSDSELPIPSDEYDFITFLSCPKCESSVEVYHKKEKDFQVFLMKQLFFSSNQGKRFTLWVLESATEQNNNSLTIEDVDFIEARLWPNRTLKLQ